MVLPAPNLDDRRFQDLVDDGKRLVQQRCPEWTEHNVSDPGVTLIEAFAQMVDQLIYRLNRVPERHYIKFLELIGVELRPPAAARGEVTFWLSAAQPHNVLVREATEVATPRTDVEDPVVFTTAADLDIVPCSFAHAATHLAGVEPVDQTPALGVDDGFPCFSPTPTPGDALLVGLSNAVPSCAVVLRVDCRVAGVGVDPRRPPLAWEAWTGAGWTACEVDRDDTGGFNRPGDVVLHVPATHHASIIVGQRAGWLRCRLVTPQDDQPMYREPPKVRGLSAFTIGGTVRMVHAEVIRDELLGQADGTPAQRFLLQRRPVVPWEEPTLLYVSDGERSEEWRPVPHFAESGPQHRHFRLDAFAGEVQLAPAVRQPDGSLRYFGAVPPKGSFVRISAYRTGGGRRGNVARGQVRVLKTSVPYVARVENRVPAVGGADAETLADAKIRGPVMLRTRGRAVTAEDFEELAREVAPDAARVHCAAADGSADADGVRLLVVPHVAGDSVGRITRQDLTPPEATLARITSYLDERRLVGTRLHVGPPDYQWLTAVVSVTALARHQPDEVREDVLKALYLLFHPVVGGPAGTGWPFGRPVQSAEVYAALARVPGVDLSRDISVQLYPAEPGTGRRSQAVQRLDLPPQGLVFSYEHQVRVRP